MGIPTVILTAVVGASAFGALQKSEALPFWGQAIIIFVSLAATTGSTLQAFLRFAESSEKHRAASAKYSALERDIRMFLASVSSLENKDKAVREYVDTVKRQLDRLEQETPILPQSWFSEKWITDYKKNGVPRRW